MMGRKKEAIQFYNAFLKVASTDPALESAMNRAQRAIDELMYKP
jgi:hypothetical protein